MEDGLLRLRVQRLVLGGCDAESQPDFKVCESTYALCTTAACEPIDGDKDTVSCACDVKTGYSAGEEPCTGEIKTEKGTQISSRYYPITGYAACNNDRPWAWCLDKPCIVDADDPAKASCACTVTKDKGPYLVVTDTYTDTTCTTKMWSSATVARGQHKSPTSSRPIPTSSPSISRFSTPRTSGASTARDEVEDLLGGKHRGNSLRSIAAQRRAAPPSRRRRRRARKSCSSRDRRRPSPRGRYTGR